VADSFWPRWQRRGACRRPDVDPDAFFPEKGGSTRAAKAVCATCPVTAECLAYALANDERWGVYGGKSERERRKLRPARAPVARRRVA
jgi:WhiB family transcriptional regulator, redox-sensing transcriptional regulator